MSSSLLTRFSHASMMVDVSLVVVSELEEHHRKVGTITVELFSERIAALEALLPELRQVEAQLKQCKVTL